MSPSRLFRALAAVGLVAAVCLGAGLRPAGASSDAVVNGEGSNFTLTAMQQWLVHFPNVNYQGIGSPDGLNQFFPPQGPQAAQPIHFIETDIPYTPGQLSTHSNYPLGPAAKGGTWSYVPIAAGGISFMYHLHDANGQPVGTLRLNQIAIADIMTFKITQWNDPYLADLNPGIALPNEKIHLVVDSTASGQTYLLTQYFLSNPTTAALYQSYTGDTAPQANWGPLINTQTGPVVGPCSPECIAEAGPSAQAEEVSQSSNEGFLAYVPTAYAVSDHEPVAAVQNYAGKYTLPSHDDVTAALDSAFNPNGTGVFDGYEEIDWNAPAPTAYSISTYSYMLVWLAPTKVPGLTEADADAVANFGEWAITVGQENAYDIGYAPISNVLIQFGLQTYESVPGAGQGVAIPCIPGSEGNKCNQDPPGPCLGGGETAGSPGSCGVVVVAPPPSVLPPAPGQTNTGSSGHSTTGSAANNAATGSANRAGSPGHGTTVPLSSSHGAAAGSSQAPGAANQLVADPALGQAGFNTLAPGVTTIRQAAGPSGRPSQGWVASMLGGLLGATGVTIAALVLALSALAAWLISRGGRRVHAR